VSIKTSSRWTQVVVEISGGYSLCPDSIHAEHAMKPSTALNAHRSHVRQLVASHNSANPRVFGSAAMGQDAEGSDLDLLVDPLPGTTLLDLGGLQVALEEILGVPVDVRTPRDLPASFRLQVLARALPV
jgi:uncharacterized protein